MSPTPAPRRCGLEKVRRTRSITAGLSIVLLGLSLGALGVADPGILVQIDSLALDAPTFRERAARVAELDWPTLGSTWPERRRRFLELWIDDALLVLAAEREPSRLPPARDAALARALAASLASDAARDPPSDADVRAYLEAHRGEFETPRALTLSRILLASEADARAVITELVPPTPALFGRIARDRSTDSATRMRAGNLGRVRADGQTEMPELRVSPALFAAADRVRDGELVPTPVPEGKGFAVIWRRATHTASHPPAASTTARIAERLAERRAAAARQALLERLRSEHLRDHHPDRLVAYEARFPEPSGQERAPGAPAEITRQPLTKPEPTDRGLR